MYLDFTRKFGYASVMMLILLTLLGHGRDIYLAELSGVVSPASSAYILRVIDLAEEKGAGCVIIKLDTPGGLDESMREITKRILNAKVPVIVYVGPKGARAASAGLFILYASHLAAMAPGTNVGAAHPVSLGGQEVDSLIREKVCNDAVAYLKAIAKARKRNIAWAEKAVRESASIDAEAALKMNVCDLLAENEDDLINRLEGRSVTVGEETIILTVESARVKKISMTLSERLLLIITNPNIAYILLLLGIYGLLFELQNPGMIFPGVVGGICLILGFYALHLLPVNYAGVALIVLAAILFILEIYLPSYGVLTIGGIVSLVVGSLILFGSNVPFLRISWEVIMLVIMITVAFIIFLLILGVRAQFRRPTTGKEGLIGETGEARTEISNKAGTVFVHGELWNAVSDKPIKKNNRVKVVGVEGAILRVEAI